jgi:hypothetical protein
MVEGAESWLNAVSFIIVTTSPRKELNDQDDTQRVLIRNLVRRNIEDKEGGTNE